MKTIIKTIMSKLGKMKLVILAIGMVGVVALLYVAYQQLNDDGTSVRAANGGDLYIEEVVTKGDIVVGLTELGTVNLNTIEYAYEFTTIIEESFVSIGEAVETGTVLAKINTDSFEEGYESLEEQLETANLQYNELLLAYDTSKLSLEKTYNDKINDGTNAEAIYNLSVAELENDLLEINVDITDLTNSITSINSQISSLYANYGFDALNATVTAIQTKITAKQSEIDNLGTTDTGSDTGSDMGSDTGTDTDNTTEPKTKEELEDELDALEIELLEAQSKVTSTTTSYDSALSSLYSQLNSTTSSLAKKETEKENYNTTLAAKQLDVQYEYDTTVSMSATALSEYNSALAKLNSNLENAKEEVETIEQEIADYLTLLKEGEVIATSNGYIMTMSDVDTEIRESVAIVTIAESDQVEIAVSIDQEDISGVTVGMEVLVNFDAYEEYTLKAYVDELSIVPSSGISSSVSYDVVVVCDLLEYPELVVYQGMTASTTFIQMQTEDVLLISNKCIINEDGKQYVKIKNEAGTITQIEIQTGFSDGFDVEVTSGLVEGDIVIIESVVS